MLTGKHWPTFRRSLLCPLSGQWKQSKSRVRNCCITYSKCGLGDWNTTTSSTHLIVLGLHEDRRSKLLQQVATNPGCVTSQKSEDLKWTMPCQSSPGRILRLKTQTRARIILSTPHRVWRTTTSGLFTAKGHTRYGGEVRGSHVEN
jgi:hypothetical protein